MGGPSTGSLPRDHSSLSAICSPGGGDLGEPSFSDVLRPGRWQINPDAAVIVGWMLLDDRSNTSSEPITEQAVAHDRDLYTWITAEWAPSGAVHSRTSVALTSSERSLTGDPVVPGRGERPSG